ncbi:hypothetical protein SAMN05444487_104172 [Marininema mesophilum]|uniref:Uncharacterized protein n=1 Tax=Marininema mesophilum TaxID=1048340 RepID=A0A1H2UPC3_9BACL|nr:hypothetical protein [Marininema mesophilum]SDW57977.1 hypothetical protein SAMN05444487_104172 [Marininema mesophilum]
MAKLAKLWWQALGAWGFSFLSVMWVTEWVEGSSSWNWWRILSFESLSAFLFLCCGAFLGSRVVVRGVTRYLEFPLPMLDPLRRKNLWPGLIAGGSLIFLFYKWNWMGRYVIFFWLLREVWNYIRLKRVIQRSGWKKNKASLKENLLDNE